MITKKNIKRLYYMRVVLFIFHLRATYNIFFKFLQLNIFNYRTRCFFSFHIRNLRIAGFNFI